jgi:hypothetical protein
MEPHPKNACSCLRHLPPNGLFRIALDYGAAGHDVLARAEDFYLQFRRGVGLYLDAFSQNLDWNGTHCGDFFVVYGPLRVPPLMMNSGVHFNTLADQ